MWRPTHPPPETRSPAGRLVRRLEVSFAGSIIEAGKQNQDLQFSNHPASLYIRAGGVCVDVEPANETCSKTLHLFDMLLHTACILSAHGQQIAAQGL